MVEKYWWLNGESQAVLNRGYLLKGETVEDAVKRITTAMAERLNMPELQPKFQEIVELGYVSLSSPIWANMGTKRGLPISCVSGETWINTINGGKLAKDIVVGDYVLTHKNRFKKVLNVIPTKNRGDIWKLKVNTRMTNLYLTGDHKVKTNLGWVRIDELDVEKHLIAVNGNLEYKEENYTIDLKPFTPYPFSIVNNTICKSIENVSEKSKKRNLDKNIVTYYSQPYEKITLTENLAWCFGLWFAEGSLSKNNKGKPNGIRITLNLKDESFGDFWLEEMCKAFNLKGSKYKSTVVRKGKESSWLNYNINSLVIGEFFKSFGDGCKIKELPDWFLNLPKQFLIKFIDGIIEGDGFIKEKEAKLSLSNPKLLLQIYNICLKIGYNVSLQMQQKVSETALNRTQYVYYVVIRNYKNSLSKNNKNAGILFYDDLIYCPIKTLEKTNRIEDVYDFTVEEDHSFSCAGVVVHNCNNVHIPDNIEGIFEKLSEVGMQTKLGAGTSGYFGELRGRGASITDNGKSSGSVSFMQLFDTAMSVVSQGCFKSNAEILTKDGFIPFKELIETRDKEVITFDFDTQNNIVYFPTKPLDYIKYNYSGEMYKFKYKDFEIEVTADHNMLLIADNYDTFTVTAEELEKTFEDWKHLNLAILPSGEVKDFKLVPLKNVIITTHKFNNPVYCVEVETHNIIVRNNKKSIPILISNSTRRGSFASYLDIDHPDIKEFLQIKDIGHPIQNLFYGVCIPDYWMQEMIDGDEEKREIWAKVLESRQQKGLPYLFFTDNVNKNKPEIYKKLGLKINASNLCSEIALPSTKDESFVCCLASLNLELYDEWKNTDTVKLLTYMLEAVMEEYIVKTENLKFMEASHKFSKRHRAIGIGTLGLHSYYQKLGRPFGHPLNIGLNKQIFSYIKEESYKASEELAKIFGPAPIFLEALEQGIELTEPLRRHTTLMAIAP